MIKSLENLDWGLLQSFLAVAETGSLSAAARKLGQSQPTLGRQIRSAEIATGLSLFRREPRGLALTDEGAALLEPARAMADAAAKINLLAAGRDENLSGTVRITASVVVSHYLMPKIIARIRKAEPEIEIELAPSDTAENLIYREADIALRMFRPTQLDVVARHICDLPTGLYAAKSYLDTHGTPHTVEELFTHDFVGFDRSETIIDAFRLMGREVDRHFFPIRCDQQAVYWELVRAGCGIGGMQCPVGEAEELVSRVMPEISPPDLPVWLTIPEPLRHSGRVRRVSDILAQAFHEIGHP